MTDVLFVRELAADHDLVLAFAADGSPAWALDLGSGLQWWYPGGERAQVREAIAEQWSTFATMPISAASYAGPHPALELGRQADSTSRVVAPPSSPADTLTARALRAFRALSPPGRLAVSFAVLAVVLMVLPALAAFVLRGVGLLPSSPGRLPSTSGAAPDVAGVAPATAAEGQPCDVRGLVSHDADGHVLVCVAPNPAIPSVLAWRS